MTVEERVSVDVVFNLEEDTLERIAKIGRSTGPCQFLIRRCPNCGMFCSVCEGNGKCCLEQ